MLRICSFIVYAAYIITLHTYVSCKWVKITTGMHTCPYNSRMAITTRILYISPLLSLATDDLPISSQLTHVREMGDPAYSSDPPELIPPSPSTGIPTDNHQPPILICNGLPPIPPNLVKRVEQGLFIEMSEILPEHLCSTKLNLGDQTPSTIISLTSGV